VITKDIVDFQAVKLHFESNNLSFYSFFPKSDKAIKAVLRHLSNNTPAEDIVRDWETSDLTLLVSDSCQPPVGPRKNTRYLPFYSL
jgi:hypothetical protein